MSDPAIRMTGICKAFDRTVVLREVDFEVRRGEVHALAGGNGAGKSTLMKILQGVHAQDAGEILIEGRPVRLGSIAAARAAGIGMVFQEFSLVPTLTVAQNVFLNAEPKRGGLIDDRESSRRARALFADMGVTVDTDAVVGRLGTAYWQLTEIAKALAQDARVLILDEPTASLARHESEALFALIGRLKARGIAIIYISHRMDEVYRIADRITILRDGRRLFTRPLTEVTPAQVVEGIVGRKIGGELAYRARSGAHAAEPLLEVRSLSAGPRVRNVSFSVRAGEVLGLAGLMGSGRTELARALFGVDRATSGEIWIRGRRVRIARPADAMAAGMAFIPEDRRVQGLVLDHSVRENLLLPLLPQVTRQGLVRTEAATSLSRRLIERFQVKAPHPERPVRLLSGGNQQKVVIAKWLGTEPDVLLMDEPTAGVDIGTKTEIVEMIRAFADAGKAVIVISSEYPELLAVSDTILVLREGAIAATFARAEIADEAALELAVQGVQ
jgi:ribose transport system ATP-binding protein